MGETGIVYDDVYLEHMTTEGHPERPKRLTAIVERLKTTGLHRELKCIDARPAEADWIQTVHTASYMERARQAAEGGARYLDTMDVPISAGSYKAAVMAAGGALAAVDAVMAGQVRNAFCAVRPPGHHALADRAMGFCIFNNVAIATKYIQRKYNLGKVLIVDWDVHHGNGTQGTFYEDPTVLYFSTHQYPFYPGSGAANERGAGKGVGTTINVPLPAFSGDDAYREAFEEQLVPAATKFGANFVLISAGFDAHQNDLLGSMKVTEQGFADLTRMVKGLAELSCEGRIVAVLEGGYHLEGLAKSVEAHIRVLME